MLQLIGIFKILCISIYMDPHSSSIAVSDEFYAPRQHSAASKKNITDKV
jgi:hypothetical protein